MQPTRVLLTPSWFSAVARLDKRQLGTVYAAVSDWMRFYESAGPHPVDGYVSLAVNDDMRALAHLQGDVLVLFHVDHHEPAYAWSSRRPLDPEAVDEIVVRIREERVPAEPAPVQPPGPLAHVSQRNLERLGVPATLAEWVQRAAEPATLELAKLLPRATSEALLELLVGESVSAVVSRYKTGVARDALEAMDEARIEIAVRDGQVVSPGQRRAVLAKSTGAYKVTGGPGTGKTVVAIHRAHFLASSLFGTDPRPVLLTCPVPTFVGALRRQIGERCASEPAVLARIEVRSLAEVADALSGRPRATAAQLDACWDAALARAEGLRWSRAQFEAERAQVLDRHDAWTWEAYRDAERVGRITGLDARGREIAWAVLSAFEEALERTGAADPIARARHARARLGRSPYAAIVCDEVQDCAPGELRLLAALAREGDAIRPNGLFLVGDGYQRVYGRPVPLGQCGIDVGGGRSRVLRDNYRTNEGIRQAAMRAVAEVEVDPIDGDEDEGPNAGYRSLRPGFPPDERAFASAAEELDFIAESWLRGRAGTFVLARTEVYRDALAAGLRARDVPVTVLADDQAEPDADGVTVCTMHRSKGLETPRVVIAGAQLLPQPYAGNDAGEQRWHEANEQRLLYGAMQRARDWLAITRVG